MKVLFVPLFDDNYSYFIVNEQTNEAIVVDPAEPDKVLNAAAQHSITIKSIFTTHHHWDHANGNAEMVKKIEGMNVYGGDERIAAMTNKVAQGDEINEIGFKFSVFSAPCHTTGHVLYYLHHDEFDRPSSVLFTGDTLFLGACGKFFEGTAEQMYDNFHNKIMPLPDHTLLYPGHEYSVANLKWVLSFDADNEKAKEKYEWCVQQRAAGLPTLPSTVAEEKSYNPFMRLFAPSVLNYTSLSDSDSPISIFRTIRELKNNFRA